MGRVKERMGQRRVGREKVRVGREWGKRESGVIERGERERGRENGVSEKVGRGGKREWGECGVRQEREWVREREWHKRVG